jgi:hypothetical protein
MPLRFVSQPITLHFVIPTGASSPCHPNRASPHFVIPTGASALPFRRCFCGGRTRSGGTCCRLPCMELRGRKPCRPRRDSDGRSAPAGFGRRSLDSYAPEQTCFLVTSNGDPTFALFSRPQPRRHPNRSLSTLSITPPSLSKLCHPDRSEAEWSDLLSVRSRRVRRHNNHSYPSKEPQVPRLRSPLRGPHSVRDDMPAAQLAGILNKVASINQLLITW